MSTEGPDSTAVRVSLWRALHLEIDSPPPVFDDAVGLRLIAPDEGWRQRPDMHPEGTRGYRASIVGRARFVEDLVLERVKSGVEQYVILGAGIDTFAQRKSIPGLRVFEVDKPGTQEWKRRRLIECGFGVPESLRLVPVNFEAGELWSERLAASGFDPRKPAMVASIGVSMYLTRDAIASTLREIAGFAPGSIFAMTFLLPLELLPEEERAPNKMLYERARAAGTPFISFFKPAEILALARECGFRHVKHVSREDIIRGYFAGRSDGFQPSSGEEFLVANT